MICEPYTCIFVHTPKAAGQRNEQVFMDPPGLNWSQDRELLHLQAKDDSSQGTEELAHLAASEYVRCGPISQQKFSRYFKFSFVLNKLTEPGWDDRYRHVMPQCDMLHDTQENLLADFHDHETREAAAEYYRRDIETFGHQLPFRA